MSEVFLLRYTEEPEKTIALASKLCYSSSSIEELISEINKIDTSKFIKKLFESGHLSPFEHASATFGLDKVSRSLLAQITRHRIASFSVKSMRYVSYSNIENNKFDKTYFDIINTKEKAYILGILFADGNIYIKEYSGHYIISIKLKDEDKYLLYRIKNLLGATNPIYKCPDNNCYKLQFGCKYMVNVLINKYGLIPNKSLIKEAKKVLNEIPEIFHNSFIRGYFDGNGSVDVSKDDKSKVFVSISCFSKKFLDDLKNNIPVLRDRNTNHNHIVFQGKYISLDFLNYIYKDIDIIDDLHMSRKLYKALEIFQLSETRKNIINSIGKSFVIPRTILENNYINEFYKTTIDSINLYTMMIIDGIPKEDARFVLPIASHTSIMLTMNFRELIHFFNIRCCNRSQWEIKSIARKMLYLVKQIAPNVFENAGPNCLMKKCPEGEMTCSKFKEIREIFKNNDTLFFDIQKVKDNETGEI